MRKFRYRIATLLGVLALAAGALLTGGGTSAHAAAYHEIWLAADSQFCITSGGGVGSAFVLGNCANAQTQEFQAVQWSSGVYLLQNEGQGLCITYDVANGGPDGAPALGGNCVGAQNQLFSLAAGTNGGHAWYMPYRRDSGGSYMAINDKNGVLMPFNPINESHYGSGIASESWIGP
jgi:hypothetical protein